MSHSLLQVAELLNLLLRVLGFWGFGVLGLWGLGFRVEGLGF